MGDIDNSKIIRDAVHGDIEIESKFINLIDTPEFQRLRRIKQLSTIYSLFPTANHTRFSHSIGTFHVMKMLINHFQPIFKEIGISIKEREIDLALSAALLHDIGHGPFSHAFEDVLPNKKDQRKHEAWTVEIITSSKSEINKVLKNNFDKDFPSDLSELILKERKIKKYKEPIEEKNIDLFFIMSSLISSQIDADRMDYLLRDAFFTGVAFGEYDISRLINSLTITVKNNNYKICVKEKYLSTIEDYLLSRYKMYEGVYYHRFKCEYEIVVKKILYRAYELFNENKLTYIPEEMKEVFNGEKLTLEKYLLLDDIFITYAIKKWMSEKDKILSKLSKMFINREKYKIIDVLDNSDKNIELFKKELIHILDNYGYHTELEIEYFWDSLQLNKETYKTTKNNIWILRRDGTIKDLSDISNIINKDLSIKININFIHLEFLKFIETLNEPEKAIQDIENLVKKYDQKTHSEIEKKYALSERDIFEKFEKELYTLENYQVVKKAENKLQIDYYYDDKKMTLFDSNRTLRIREKDSKKILTIKLPLDDKNNKKDKSERLEYELEIKDKDLEGHKDYILNHMPDLRETFDSLKESLVVKNNRSVIILKNKPVVFEIVFDQVEYINGTKSYAYDYQIEIELKSDYLHRVNLKMLSDRLENNIIGLETITESKYKRGLRLTKEA